jgi:protein-tyrosine phosphatase
MRLLFVCLGNICRSPAAETIMRHKLRDAGLEATVAVDSAGTASYHCGELPDPRTRVSLQRRGYRDWSRARQVTPDDFRNFQHILAMDRQNLRELKRLCPDPAYWDKVRLIGDFVQTRKELEVPDPYYGSPDDFELVLDILEDACSSLIEMLQGGAPPPRREGG